MTFTDIVSRLLNNDYKCVEPVRRKKGSRVPQWQVHRFPIKGGISILEVMAQNIFSTNQLFQKLSRMGTKGG